MADVSKVIMSYLVDFYRSMGIPVSMLESAFNAYSVLSRYYIWYPNRRVEHLAKYGKKYRTRKKNCKRALKI